MGVAQATESKALLYEALTRLGLRHWKSAANFVLVHGGDRTPELVARHDRRGVLVRDRARSRAAPAVSASPPVSSNTRGGHRGAGGPVRKALIDRKTAETHVTVALRSKGAAASTTTPACASSTTCWIWWPATARSIWR